MVESTNCTSAIRRLISAHGKLMGKMKNIEKNSACFFLTSLLAIGCVLFWIYCLYPIEYSGYIFIIIAAVPPLLLFIILNTRTFVASKSRPLIISGAILVLTLVAFMLYSSALLTDSFRTLRESLVFFVSFHLFILFLCVIMSISYLKMTFFQIPRR